MAQLADGEWVSAPMGEFSQDTRLELVHVDGVPSHYREKLAKGEHTPINKTTASYLQPTKSIKATEYVNSAFKDASPLASSSSEGSVASFNDKYADSLSTTPKIPEAPSGLWIEIPSKSEIGSSPLATKTERSTEYGRRLLPKIMDDLAASEPERTVFSLASLSNGLLKLNPISAQQFTRSVDKTAWWLREQVGNPVSIQPVAYIGPRRF